MNVLDAVLILPFRLPSDPLAGFYLGCALLAFLCLILGDASRILVSRINRDHLRGQRREMTRMHNLSIRAIAAGDKAGYKGANAMANEYFGKSFFAGAALFTSSIWPLPFALAWLHERFAGVDIPLPPTGKTVGYNFVFLALYLILRLSWWRLKLRLPALGRLDPDISRPDPELEPTLRWSDLRNPDGLPPTGTETETEKKGG